MTRKSTAESVVKDIRIQTSRKFNSEEKINSKIKDQVGLTHSNL